MGLNDDAVSLWSWQVTEGKSEIEELRQGLCPDNAALAMALQAHAGLLVDEARGRAKLDVAVVGVCGLLLFAKREGWIAEVAPLLDHLRISGYNISPALRKRVLLQSGAA